MCLTHRDFIYFNNSIHLFVFFFSSCCISGAAGLLTVLRHVKNRLCLCVSVSPGVQEAVIEPGTTAYENWVATGVKVYRQFWFFDLKNPQEVLQYGARPVVLEKGPYTYT